MLTWLRSRALLLSIGLVVLVTGPPASAQAAVPPDIVVAVSAGHTISEVIARFPVRLSATVLASQSIYLVQATNPKDYEDATSLRWFADGIADSAYADSAEPYSMVGDTRFHGWPNGFPAGTSTAADYATSQPLARTVAAVRSISRGAGVKVAVLDTGVDATHPALAGKVLAGRDWIDDDANPAEVAPADGKVDLAYGHGTFVAGLVTLVAPDAKIIPERVLGTSGLGNPVIIARAVDDAVSRGANVINLSLGSNADVRSDALDAATKRARDRGVLVVVAAGNTGSSAELYPGEAYWVMSVACVAGTGSTLASFSSYGSWADVAGPGDGVVGPLPGNRYARWSGTSMAAGIVSGQAALLKAKKPSISLSDQIYAIRRSSTDLSGSHDVSYGAINIAASLQRV